MNRSGAGVTDRSPEPRIDPRARPKSSRLRYQNPKPRAEIPKTPSELLAVVQLPNLGCHGNSYAQDGRDANSGMVLLQSSSCNAWDKTEQRMRQNLISDIC